ncbi:hypothetical protein M378DRAFT_159340 [Amanita muscaria Koide BX008]|uniref:Uncharacterized protein n=1 Tax=Amanita muscaria (strain Koide BX008) TaxID=946122 RepID=A0A0C2X0C6_AMAMK|nr:hypothetical protein M378DRAFT_159340 [Amanita muscaria Koide BX008]
MNSAIVRRVTGVQAIAGRHFVQPSRVSITARAYSSPTEERDPQLNGYPQLPWVSRQTLPPKGWQDEQMRRNFGDTLHEQDEVLSVWGPDPAPLPIAEARKQFILAALGFVGVGFFIKEYLTPEPPAVRRQYPFDGLVKELGGETENKARAEGETRE